MKKNLNDDLESMVCGIYHKCACKSKSRDLCLSEIISQIYKARVFYRNGDISLLGFSIVGLSLKFLDNSKISPFG